MYILDGLEYIDKVKVDGYTLNRPNIFKNKNIC